MTTGGDISAGNRIRGSNRKDQKPGDQIYSWLLSSPPAWIAEKVGRGSKEMEMDDGEKKSV